MIQSQLRAWWNVTKTANFSPASRYLQNSQLWTTASNFNVFQRSLRIWQLRPNDCSSIDERYAIQQYHQFIMYSRSRVCFLNLYLLSCILASLNKRPYINRRFVCVDLCVIGCRSSISNDNNYLCTACCIRMLENCDCRRMRIFVKFNLKCQCSWTEWSELKWRRCIVAEWRMMLFLFNPKTLI